MELPRITRIIIDIIVGIIDDAGLGYPLKAE